jgi:type II secretory ATPase GspE/PulE/Tfp pilus assembly ATPase PilB-like protein
MISMRQDGLLKVVSGLTTIDEVIKATKTEG